MAPPATVVIAAGGTAGHVVPALAVADALQAEGAAVSFIGAAGRPEEELVPAAGYEIETLPVEGLDRRNPLRAARALARAAAAVGTARRILDARSADVVIGGGGYVAGPVGLAAILSRRPLVLTEADRRLGLANRLLAPWAHRVCLAFPISGRRPPRYVVTGRPVPAAIARADRDAARARFGIAAADRCVLVFGGSQGARSINRAATAAFADPQRPRDFHVLHLSGERDHAEVERAIADHGADRYTLLAYEPGLADALAACDLVVARAGGSVFEIAAAGRPAILVPYPHAAGRHQHANAAWMADAGAAVVVEDAELDGERLARLADELIADPERLEAMAAAATRLAMPDAAERVAAVTIAAAPA